MPVRHLRQPRCPTEWSERELLRRVLRGQERAWAELLRRYRPLIYRCVAKVSPPRSSAADLDEIYADVLMNLLRDDMRKLRLFDPGRGTKLGTWIGMISVQTAYDYLRSAGRRPLLDQGGGLREERDEGDRSPLDALIEKERWDHLNGLLADFTERDRTLLTLCYAEGLDAGAVARKMSISPKTVYTKKHKIRAHLKRLIEAAQDSPIADLAHAA